jgi:Leu/Phe-tRNA-protein transferase
LHEAKGTTFTDLIVAGQYFIGSEEELGLAFEEGKPQLPVPPEKVRELISRGAWEVDFRGNAKFITPEQLARRISPTGMLYTKVSHLPGSFGKNSISQSGWVAFKQHGLHDYSTWKNSSEAKKLKKLARSLADKGWTIRFNTDYEAMLEKIKHQKRSYRDQEVGDDGQLVKRERKEHEAHTSRYNTQTVYDSMLALLKSGKGYSVGVYNDQGVLVGGEIGVRRGNHLYGDSVFYDEVEYAKIAALALFEVLDAAGMPYSDPGMITPYTASMGAELVPFPEYLQKIKSGPRELIELPSVWDPRDADYVKNALGEVVKRKSQGLGNLKVTRRTPVIAADDSAAAALGLERSKLNLVFVSSPAQAAADVVNRAWADLPIYVEGATATKSDNALEYLREALKGDVKVYYIGSARHPEARKEIPLKQLLDVLELNVATDPPVWSDGSTITVNGWGFKPNR